MSRQEVCRVAGDRRVRSKLPAPEERISSFNEAEPVFTVEEAIAEARRCSSSSPCLYCDVCQLVCPDLAITRDPKTDHIVIDLEYCKGCGLCSHYCPHGAIEMVLDE